MPRLKMRLLTITIVFILIVGYCFLPPLLQHNYLFTLKALAAPLVQNTYSDCPPNSSNIWVRLDTNFIDPQVQSVLIPFDSGETTISSEVYVNYLLGVLMTEVGPDADFTPVDNETLKAMAIAARTVAYKNCGLSLSNFPHDGIDDNIKQVYDPRNRETWLNSPSLGQAELDRYQQAIDDTAGMYLTYNNTVFDAQYRDKSDDSTDDYDEDGDGTIEPHKGIYDPAGKFHATPTYLTPGLMQVNANHWATGENHGEALPNWNYQQILTHYYTGIHIRDENSTIITPEYRWNLLDLSWAEAGCPAVILENSVCTGTFLIQNTGVAAWNTSRIYLDHYTLAEQANRSTNALINPIAINVTAQPGEAVTVTKNILPPSGAIVGSRQTIRFDMAYDEDIDFNYFSMRETGRPWYTFDVESCVGYCATYIPLVTKD